MRTKKIALKEVKNIYAKINLQKIKQNYFNLGLIKIKWTLPRINFFTNCKLFFINACGTIWAIKLVQVEGWIAREFIFNIYACQLAKRVFYKN